MKINKHLRNILITITVISIQTSCNFKNNVNTNIMDTTKLKVSYFFSAETVYDKIEIDEKKIKYTFFEDTQNKCAQWIQQTPCWGPNDLKHLELSLSDEESKTLEEKIVSSNFLNTKFIADSNLLMNRAYPYTLKISLNDKSNEIVYLSRPDGQKMPEPFKIIMDYLQELKEKHLNKN